jgi:ABC-type xylose transport system permease subunit
VSRNIDLWIGSVLAVVALVMALLQTDWIPNGLGVGPNQPYLDRRGRDRLLWVRSSAPTALIAYLVPFLS